MRSGDGLADPTWTRLMDWARASLPKSPRWHYRLVRTPDVAKHVVYVYLSLLELFQCSLATRTGAPGSPGNEIALAISNFRSFHMATTSQTWRTSSTRCPTLVRALSHFTCHRLVLILAPMLIPPQPPFPFHTSARLTVTQRSVTLSITGTWARWDESFFVETDSLTCV